jgi:hypothetical protein
MSADAQHVRYHLDAFNCAATGVSAWYPLHLSRGTRSARPWPAFRAVVWGGWLRISCLRVDEAARGGEAMFGILDDCPKGHRKFFLRKKL